MKCIRCGKEVDSTIPELNVARYGQDVLWACPNCGKAYNFHRIVQIKVTPIPTDKKEDDWGKPIVKTSRKYKDE